MEERMFESYFIENVKLYHSWNVENVDIKVEATRG